jgi:hypothetical protein
MISDEELAALQREADEEFRHSPVALGLFLILGLASIVVIGILLRIFV